MAKKSKEKDTELDIVKKIENEIDKFDKKKNRFYFYVMDTKGVPNGSLSYIYETALYLSDKGYDVTMLHSEKDFSGVGSWLIGRYADLKHNFIEKDNVGISPADVLIIPEVYSSVMYATRNLPCKRIALLQNFGYFTEMTQAGATWKSYGINECITTSESLATRIKSLFPTLKTYIVRPSINEEYFYDTDTPKKLIVNFVCKNQQDANAIIKPFYLKYPLMKWVCMRTISQLPKDEFGDALREAAITVWVDDKTDFGYTALEAMACGNLVIGKLPEIIPEWIFRGKDAGDIRDNAVYFNTSWDACDILFNVISAYIRKNIPDVIAQDAKDTLKYYTRENQGKDIEKVYLDEILASVKENLEKALEAAKNK